MSQDGYKLNSQTPGAVCVFVRLLGTGAAAPTKEVGNGVTASRVSIGVVRLTFVDHIGEFLGATFGFGNAAPTATTAKIVQYDHDSYTAAGKALDITVATPATDLAVAALADLATTDKLSLVVWFKTTGA